MKWFQNGRVIRNGAGENVAYAMTDEECKAICVSHNLVVDDLMARYLVKTEPNGALCQRCLKKLTTQMYYVPSRYEPVCPACMTDDERGVEALRRGVG